VPKTLFCDTSVLFAASDTVHQHHAASLAVVERATRDTAFCAAHSLAELYATLTATPAPHMRRIGDVLANVEQAAQMFKPVTLTAAEYVWVVRHVAETGARSGQIYDAIILKCAEKADAEVVYTWNPKHFQRVAWPAVAAKIHTPSQTRV
jgi:predicted nucleic acid-binding protein